MNTETIVAAAIACARDDMIYSLPPPNRHHNVIAIMPLIGNGPRRSNSNDVQGFLTSTGRFVGRREALVIAQTADQIIRRCGGDNEELFTENLW